MKKQITAIILGAMATLAPAQQLPVGSISSNRTFAIRSGTSFRDVDLTNYEGKILLLMMMTPWCPFCQSNAQAVGNGILDHFNSTTRGTLQGKNANGIEIHSILLSTEEAASWDNVNASFSASNGYEEWGIDANALRSNPRQNLGYFRGGFITGSNLYNWGDDRRRVVVLNLVRESASHGYREIVINQNSFSEADSTTARSAIDAVRAAPVITAPVITRQPVPATIIAGNTAKLRVLATGTSPTFQWFKGAVGNTTSPVRGGKSATLITPVLKVSTTYWVRITNPAGSVRSKAVTVTVMPASVPSMLWGS